MARKVIKTNEVQPKNETQKSNCTALYIRVSTQKQADEGYSLDAQESRLRAFCEAQQWNVCDNHVYVDAGLSGKSTENRDAFNAMLQAAQEGKVKRIVAIKLDRLARNTKDFLGLVETLQSYSCDLVLIKESFDTGTPQGKLALTLFAAIAEFEASTITERVMTGKAQKANEGGYNGSQCPLGYTYQDGQFTLNSEADTVRYIFDSFIGGMSQLAIAQKLNAMGKVTKNGKEYSQPTVRYILTNGFYAGIAQWDGVETQGTHTPIISKEVYEAAHKRLQESKRGNPNFGKGV